jgi:glycosyltransferase involved in cell wall biosynthesis
MNMFTHKTTLIIPTRNRSSKLTKLIKDIVKLKIIFNEIIVVDSSDNHHKKKIIPFLTKKKIKLINTFPSTTHQRNVGLKVRKKNSKYILFLDDDIIINKKAFIEMNNGINKYSKINKICSFAFNLQTNKKKFKFERIKKSKLVKLLGLYSEKPGKVMKSGWHTKISNLSRDTFVQWIYSGATLFRTNIIKKMKFKNLNKGFNYLEDLHFSFNLTKKKFKHLVIAKATVSNPNLVSRNDLNFGFIEILNRYKFVETYRLNKINFYITAFIRMLYLITNILHLKTSWILRFFGNLKGIISCIILDINKKIN